MRIYIIIFLTATPFIIKAQDRYLANTYQSNVLAKGSMDLEYLTTLGTGKSGDGSPFLFGRNLESRLEFEFGIGRNWQTSFYLNTGSNTFAMKDTGITVPAVESHTTVSFSNEWKWKLSDPVANSFGSALYGEVTIGSDEYEIETKIIFDKRWGKNLFAFNITGEAGCESESEMEDHATVKMSLEKEFSFGLDFGMLHFFKPTFGIGFEIKNDTPLSEEGAAKSSVIYAGPSLFFTQNRFFSVFNFMPQLRNLHTSPDAPYAMDFNDHEQFRFRFVMGYSF